MLIKIIIYQLLQRFLKGELYSKDTNRVEKISNLNAFTFLNLTKVDHIQKIKSSNFLFFLCDSCSGKEIFKESCFKIPNLLLKSFKPSGFYLED